MNSPVFKLMAGEESITDALAPRLMELRLEDRSGDYADALELELADDGKLPMPRKGVRLSIELGYRGALSRKRGEFAIDQIAHEGPPAKLFVSATSADFNSQVRAPRERSFDAQLEGGTPRTFKRLMDEIAGEHGFSTRFVPEELGEIELPHTDQAGASDLSLASEMASLYGAMFKPANGRWLFASYDSLGEATTTLRPKDVSRWRAHFVGRSEYRSAVAHWHDFAKAKRVSEVAGEGQPRLLIHRTFVDAPTARAAAKSALDRKQREARRLRLEMPGRPDISSHQVLQLEGFREQVDGRWLTTRVSHILNKQGYRTRLECLGV